jgi:alpha-1,3-rhamnosyltransferase
MSELKKTQMNSDCMPLVSMVIPSYNHAVYIKQCIASIIEQDYENIELIIIDDGSSDDSVSRINEMVSECRSRFVRFEFRARANIGLSATMNEALKWAEGEFFSALASDDALIPGKTSSLLACIGTENDVAGVFSGFEYIDSNGQIIGTETHPETYFTFDDVLAHRHYLQTCTQLLRTDCLRATGGYLEGCYIEDWYMCLKLTELGYRLKNVPFVTTRYRYHDTNVSKDRLKMFEARKQILGHFKQHTGYRHALSVMCVWAAIDFSCKSKLRSLGYLWQAACRCPRLVASRYFVKGLLIWATPCSAVRNADRLKIRWPRLFAYLPSKL